jgi:hypothetical protein
VWNDRPAASTNLYSPGASPVSRFLWEFMKQVLTLSLSDVSYLAGLIDGEGTVTLSRRHKNRQPELAISISSTERQLLEFALRSTGVGKITNKKRYKAHHLPSYVYGVTNQQALKVLRQIAPHLLSYKRKRADLILSKYTQLTPRNGKYSRDLLTQREAFVRAVLAIKAIPGDYFLVEEPRALYIAA